MQLSVVIPTLGRSPALPRTLRRLVTQRGASGYEIVVVVDAEGDEEAAWTAHEAAFEGGGANDLDLLLLRAARPGASSARNRGWQEAAHPVVLFLGDDILPAPDLLARHRTAHAADPRDEFGVLGHVRWAHRPSAFERWLERGVQSDYGAITGDRADWGFFYTTNVSVKRALLERAGGFDEDLPFLYEDLDLGRRLSDLGLELRYDRAALGEHDHPATLEAWGTRMEAIGRAERAFCARHPDVSPYFRDRLSRAAAGRAARGRGARLAGLVGPGVPWLGPRVWASAEASFAQQLWPAFQRGWESSGGSPPGGPK